MPKKKTQHIRRCSWLVADDPLYVAYHDMEWGVPVYEDQKIFEFLVLESSQAGLSWRTILNKRENYRRAFAGFDPVKVARFTTKDIGRLLMDAGIVRNRLKIEATVINANKFLDVKNEFGTFSDYIWRFVDGRPILNKWRSLKELPAVTPEAETLSRDLKSRGFKFLGPTVVYAHMQATGMVNDHTVDCFRYHEVSRWERRRDGRGSKIEDLVGEGKGEAGYL